jgi:hypothetical protein
MFVNWGNHCFYCQRNADFDMGDMSYVPVVARGGGGFQVDYFNIIW